MFLRRLKFNRLICLCPAFTLTLSNVAQDQIHPLSKEQLSEIVAALEEYDTSVETLFVRYVETFYEIDQTKNAPGPPNGRRMVVDWAEGQGGRRALITELHRDPLPTLKNWQAFDGKSEWQANLDFRASVTKMGRIDFQPHSEPCLILRLVRFYGRPIFWHFRQGLVTFDGHVVQGDSRLLRFRIDQFPYLPAPQKAVFVLDPAHGYLPVQIELMLARPEPKPKSEGGGGWFRAMLQEVQDFQQNAAGRWYPAKVELAGYDEVGRLHLWQVLECEKFAVNEPIPPETFSPLDVAPVGTRVTDTTNGNRISYVGGEEGARLYLQQHPEAADADAHAPPLPSGPLADARPRTRYTWTMVLGCVAVVFFVAAYWLRRAHA